MTKTGLDDDSEEMYYLFYQSTEDIPLSDYVCCNILTASGGEIYAEWFIGYWNGRSSLGCCVNV